MKGRGEIDRFGAKEKAAGLKTEAASVLKAIAGAAEVVVVAVGRVKGKAAGFVAFEGLSASQHTHIRSAGLLGTQQEGHFQAKPNCVGT